MRIKLLNHDYNVITTKEKITIADSFVVRKNKIGSGNGEAKLYVGHEGSEAREFFGSSGFTINCLMLKKDLLNYLDVTKDEYSKPQQPYLNSSALPTLWQERYTKVNELNDIIEFKITEQSQIEGPRIYVKSNDNGFKLIRELSLPNVTYISIIKISDNNGDLKYYFRLFAEFFGDIKHPYEIEKEKEQIESIADPEKKKSLHNARIGQGKYRQKLLELCPFCPITLVTDDRLLIASHIKPWKDSDEFEKTDPNNGIMLTPTFDYLFDRGFLSFSDDKKAILSPFLSKVTYGRLGISDGKLISNLNIHGKEHYLKYHRENILKK